MADSDDSIHFDEREEGEYSDQTDTSRSSKRPKKEKNPKKKVPRNCGFILDEAEVNDDIEDEEGEWEDGASHEIIDNQTHLDDNSVHRNADSHRRLQIVPVVKGELANLTGKITAIEGSKMRMKPMNKDLRAMYLEFQADELVKHFCLGDHVKVLSGSFEDETGVIVKVEQSEAILLADLSRYELKVWTKHLQAREEVATGLLDSAGQYQWGDLVQLDGQTVGVIVRLAKETFQILNMHGKLVHLKAAAILKKLNSKRAVSLDAVFNPIRVKDQVMVTDGRQGEIKHLYRGRAFLHSRSVLENGGFFVCKTQNLLLKGAPKKKPLTSGNAGFRALRMAASPMTHRPSRGGGHRADHELRGKTVKITSGHYKGCSGIVKETSRAMARVELHTSCLMITVEKTHITRVDDGGRGICRQTGTPSREKSGYRTPRYSSQIWASTP